MKPEFDYFGNIVSYNYMDYDFPTLAEAELLKKFTIKIMLIKNIMK